MTAGPGSVPAVRVLTSTVFGFGAAGCAGAVVLAAAAAAVWCGAAPGAVAVGAGVGCLAVAFVPVRVGVAATAHGVRYRRPGGTTRWIPAASIASAEAVRVPRGAIVGRGLAPSTATDRRIVAAGWALHLRLASREEIWLSTRGPFHLSAVMDPPAAGSRVGPGRPRQCDPGHQGPVGVRRGQRAMTNPDNGKQSRPWFGSKRYGLGIRPQAWQGWAITAAVVAAIVVAAGLLQR